MHLFIYPLRKHIHNLIMCNGYDSFYTKAGEKPQVNVSIQDWEAICVIYTITNVLPL